ncbi:hypothetical protein IQ07DRAFT_650835 [Pyrenochaeta sp. DS3sAY3a]|nr:hypothetical protein IQ07DRAFT_650835 [Pyrenochaeta sp. DS3sAY3a]
MLDLNYLLSLTDARVSLLEYLLPYDIARLLVATGYQLTPRERAQYMNPIRDIFVDIDLISALLQAGVKIMLLGCQLQLLFKRLNRTEDFIHQHGNDFIIDLIAIGYRCPETSMKTPQQGYLPSDRFVVSDKILKKLGTNSWIAHRWMQKDSLTLPCMETALSLMETPKTTNIRLKHFKLNQSCAQSNTINLIYPDETLNIFDWTFDPDVIETSVLIVRHDGKNIVLYSTKTCGRWRPDATQQEVMGGQRTPRSTRHSPRANLQEIMVTLKLPGTQTMGLVPLPTQHWDSK